MPGHPFDPSNAIHPQTRAEWRAWLEQYHTREQGIWLISYKRSSGKARLAYEEMIEEALCFGWVDSTVQTLDDERSIQWWAPRKPGSTWARTNKARVERMIAAGRMTPAGLAKIEAAKRDGSWDMLENVAALGVPPDLQAALDANPAAAQYFQKFPPSAKQIIFVWIADAKRPETRQRRIDETVRLAAQNKRAHQS